MNSEMDLSSFESVFNLRVEFSIIPGEVLDISTSLESSVEQDNDNEDILGGCVVEKVRVISN